MPVVSDTEALRRSRRIWPWVLFGLVLSPHVWFDLAEGVAFGLLPSYFLPLLTGWLACTHGWRVVYVLIALALHVLVWVNLASTDTLRVS